MQASEIDILSNEKIPEEVRSKIAEQILTSNDRKADRDIEKQKLDVEKQKFVWNTPIVAALAGLVTLSATFIFENLTAKGDTENTITLEQVRTELQQGVSRLKQELELDTSESLAKLEAEAKEREFQYEIVRSELDKEGKTNAERAAVLLFLARAGVLNALDANALQAMAEEQKENPNENIIPQLSSANRADIFPPQVQLYDPIYSNSQENTAFDRVFQLVNIDIDWLSRNIVCNIFRVSEDLFATMSHCINNFADVESLSSFRISKNQDISLEDINRDDFEFQPISITSSDSGGRFSDGVALILASAKEQENLETGIPVPRTRLPVVGERVFLVGYAPRKYELATTRRGLYFTTSISSPVIHRNCRVVAIEQDRVSTDCISSSGMSGAPIIAVSDGALITLSAWGDSEIGRTEGPPIVGVFEKPEL